MLQAKMTDMLKKALKSAAQDTRSLTKPVETITMVGGMVNGGVLGMGDEGHLYTIIEICRANGIRISPEATVNVTNLCYGDEQDFLKQQQPADMVVMSFLYYNPAALSCFDRGALFHDGYTFQSHLAADPDRWLSALVNTGARLAFNIVSADRKTELPTEFLDRAPYHKVDTTLSSPALEYDLLAR